MPAADIIQRAKERLEDETGAYYEIADLLDSYNEALDEISDATEIHELSAMVRPRKGAIYTDLRGVLPSEALRVTAVWNQSTSRWLDPTTVQELDATQSRGWEKSTDQPRWWLTRGLWHLGCYPAPGADTTVLRVHFAAMMPHVSQSGGLTSGLSSSLRIPADLDDAIENYIVSDLLADKGDAQKCLEHWAEFVRANSTIKDAARHRMTLDRTPHMGSRR